MPRHTGLFLALAVLAWTFWSSPSLTEIAAGVAVFLFGMMALEQGFKTFTGGALERVLKASTDRLWKSLTFGAVATTLTQSSSLVSVITISFLSAGLLGLHQGIGVIFGANLGTTTGAWLVAGLGIRVNIAAYAMPLLVFGVVMSFNRARGVRGFGQILTGIGFLFLGIHFMKEGFEAFQDSIDLSQYAVAGLAGLLLYTLLGMIATVVMQSSHATLVLIITALAAGHITYENALALSIGANVGTTITALLGAIGANIAGRRLAAAHLIFNVTTGIVALALIGFFVRAVETGADWLGIAPDNHTLKLALFHTLFNLAGIVLMVPFIGVLVRQLETRLKPRPVKLSSPKYISEGMREVPGAALEACRKELVRLFWRVFELIARVLQYEPAQLRRVSQAEALKQAPESIRPVDVDEVYIQRVKPLHGLILDYMTRLPVEGHRAQQLVLLRSASRHLIESVKDAKHLHKNMIANLNSPNLQLRREYLAMRAHLGWLLNRLNALSRDPAESLDVELGVLLAEAEQQDIVTNGHLDSLIRDLQVTPEQATSLMNDSAYVYRISKNLIAMARMIFVPFEQIDQEIAQQVGLDPAELRTLLSEAGQEKSE